MSNKVEKVRPTEARKRNREKPEQVWDEAEFLKKNWKHSEECIIGPACFNS